MAGSHIFPHKSEDFGIFESKSFVQVWLRRGGERKRLDLLVRPLQPGDPESKVILKREKSGLDINPLFSQSFFLFIDP